MSNSNSRGVTETETLRRNVTDQMERLVRQLEDLDTTRGEVSAGEYEEERSDTIEQLKELHSSLTKMTAGNLTLLDELGSVQLAIQGAISSAFKTPEIMSLFARQQPEQLRERLYQVERDYKMKNLSKESYTAQKGEVLAALLKLRAGLSDEEKLFLSNVSSAELKDFINTKGLTDTQKALNLLGATPVGRR